MERYEKYKHSGIAWLGEIPEHWEAMKLKRLTTIKRGASPRPIDDPKYFDENGEYAWVRIADVTASERYLEITTQKLSELGKNFSVPLGVGELFLSIAGSVGKPIITKIKCCIHDGFVYFPNLRIDKEFLYYIFHSGQPYLGLGKLGTQLNLNTETVGGITVGYPPIEEQKEIATYLDHKTAEIDQLIAQKQRLIELYEEEKTAIINEAVTKGINPDAKLNPTAIDWLGDIPEHWKVVRLKFLTTLLKDGTHGSFKRVAQGYRLLSVRNISGDLFVFRDDDSKISEEDFVQITQPFKVCAGDIQLAIVGATLGKVAIVPELEEEFATQRSVATIRARNILVEKIFLFDFFKSTFFQNYLWNNAGFSAQPGVYLGTLQNAYVPSPPLEEQKTIAEYIEKETARIDAKIAKTKRIIELQKEYRTALISEAVTGKIKVPDLVEEVA